MKIFKSILVGMLAVAFVGTVVGCKEEAAAASTDWKQSEHNLREYNSKVELRNLC